MKSGPFCRLPACEATSKTYEAHAKNRANAQAGILRLLGGDATALAEIETAVDGYFRMVDHVTASGETAAQVRADLEDLYRALATLETLFGGGRSTAVSLFMDELAAVGALADFANLQAGLDVNGACELAEAAKNARDSCAVRRGQGEMRAATKAYRVELISNVLRAVERARIKLPAQKKETLVERVLQSAGIWIADSATEIKQANKTHKL